MAKATTADAPYMVASYIRCEDVRKNLAAIDIYYLMELYNKVLAGNKYAEVDLKKEVEKIISLEKRVYQLERRTFLSNRNKSTEKMTVDELFETYVLGFAKNTLSIGEIEEYISKII